MMTESEKTTKEELLKDSALESLLYEDFDPKSYATSIIQSQMVGETLAKLTNGIAALNMELNTQVTSNYEDLLSQATGIEALESVLQMMQERIESLQTAVSRISKKVVDPYQKIVLKTAQLARLQGACDLLRKVIRMLFLLKRLKTQMQGGNKEITKMAQTFSELDQLSLGGDLTDIRLLEEERVWLVRARREVEAQAKRMLMQGLELMNPSLVSTALQVFFNLGQLTPTLHSVLQGFRTALQHEGQITLDPATLVQGTEGGSGPGRSTLPMLGTSASWKATLWTRLEKLVDSIYKIHSQVHQLYVVLMKKRDPTTQVTFLENISETDTLRLLVHFWETVVGDLAVEFAAAAQASTFLRQLFESDYPKLVRTFSDLISRLEKFGQSEGSGPSSALAKETEEKRKLQEGSSYETALVQALSPFEKAYITRSQTRLLDSTQQLFGPTSRGLPREEEILDVARNFNSELSSAGGSGPLAGILAKNVDKAIRLFNMKCDELVMSGRDSLQVSAGPNHAQLRNIAVTNALHAFHTILTQHVVMASSTHKTAQDIVAQSLSQTRGQMRGVVSPFVLKVGQMLKEMIESMHAEDYSNDVRPDVGGGGAVPEAPCSGFMKEMQSFTSRIHSQHLTRFLCKETVSAQLEEVTSQIVDVYVRHVTMLRPLGEGGKMQVVTDMAEMEMALAPFCHRLSDLGAPYRRLRAMRRLLFISTDQFSMETSGVGDALPFSYALNYLFSRAPHDMKSPHQVQGWSEKEYCDWMDAHPSEADRLAFIQATVESYSRQHGRKSEDRTSFCQFMMGIIKKGLEYS